MKTYKYAELSPTAQQYAYEKWEPFMGFDWWDSSVDYWKTQLEERGISNPDISFSGFYSQGDGASFTGLIDLRDLMEWEHNSILEQLKEQGRGTCPTHSLIETYPAIYISQLNINPDEYVNFNFELKRNSRHYSHENTVSLNMDVEYSDDDLEEELSVCCTDKYRYDDLEDSILEVCKSWMKDIYRDLETEYDYRSSEAAFVDDCDCQNYIFDIDGDISDDYDDAIAA